MGYRWYEANDVAPLFSFGEGLSYTRFAYSRLRVQRDDGAVEVSFRVRNTGRVAGAEVPQAYLRLPGAAGEPSKRLAGFDRVTLRPGQGTTVRLTLDPKSLDRPFSIWNTTSHAWQHVSGRYTVSVGPGVENTRLSRGFAVS